MQPHHLELLAPARTFDIGIEAINHGADAVYIGGPSFGRAPRPTTACKTSPSWCNTPTAFTAAFLSRSTPSCATTSWKAHANWHWQLYDAGVDALIIQDMGLLQIDMPPIQLHASTQTDIRTPEKAKFLQDAGLSQLVLARELTLPQISAIRDVIDTERTMIEFFVHGALCVAYSGQCFISHAHTGRSANRGDCSQACRLPYEVKDHLKAASWRTTSMC
jgi:23S rRNA 5-hydroxycytidine C2501 synthase